MVNKKKCNNTHVKLSQRNPFICTVTKNLMSYNKMNKIRLMFRVAKFGNVLVKLLFF